MAHKRIIRSPITLGTAQLGMNYGRANVIGMPSESDAINIIKTGILYGIKQIDTARAYKNSEKIIGQALCDGLNTNVDVITKLDLPQNSLMSDDFGLESAVEISVLKSCRNLRLDKLPVLLLHDWQHYNFRGGLVWKKIVSLKNENVIKTLGVSVYNPDEAIAALQDYEIKILQIPFNILDWRWRTAEFLNTLNKRPDVEVHVRSALLQGVLCAPLAYWPAIKKFDSLACLARLNKFVKDFKRLNIADLCFAYLHSKPWVSTVVVGIETLEQLKINIGLFQQPSLTMEQSNLLELSFEDIPCELLNPSLWPPLSR